MIRGPSVTLRPAQESDLDLLLTAENDHRQRGPYIAHRLASRPVLARELAETGLMTEERTRLMIVDAEDRVVGLILFFKAGVHIDGYEIGYFLFSTAERGRGYATEAVGLLVDWLFRGRAIYRLQLTIHPDNAASRRVAAKSGFHREGVLRGAFFLNGTWQDIEVWSLLRPEWEALRTGPGA
jgi:[ribosomal protein S5]-alanine N-acetyltransferase